MIGADCMPFTTFIKENSEDGSPQLIYFKADGYYYLPMMAMMDEEAPDVPELKRQDVYGCFFKVRKHHFAAIKAKCESGHYKYTTQWGTDQDPVLDKQFGVYVFEHFYSTEGT